MVKLENDSSNKMILVSLKLEFILMFQAAIICQFISKLVTYNCNFVWDVLFRPPPPPLTSLWTFSHQNIFLPSKTELFQLQIYQLFHFQ